MTIALRASDRDTMGIDAMTANLCQLYHVTSEEIIREGRLWYPRTYSLAEVMAAITGHPAPVVVGVLAALSPRSHWQTNVKVAWDMLRGGPGRGLSRSLRTAKRIINGADPLDVLNGPKTCAFYGAIMGDGLVATVDAWGTRAATNGAFSEVADSRYDDVSAAYANAAELAGENVHALQAMAWVHVNPSAQRAMAAQHEATRD